MKWLQNVRWLMAGGLCVAAIAGGCSDGDVSTDPTGTAGSDNGGGADDGGGAKPGSAGSDAEPGEAGSGTGGTTGSSAGAGPMGGEPNGAGGGDPAPQVAMCQEACAGDQDCLDGFECRDSRCVSTNEPTACSSDDLCRAELSGWTTECNEASDCLLTQVCVDIGEAMGRCASEAGGAIACTTLQQDEVETKDVDGKDVTVCGKGRAECGDDGACRERCSEDSCGEFFACNMDTGSCECDNDKACADTPNASKCVAGRCVCASDGDCTVNANKCNDGVCGCGDASVCDATAAHPGTSWVCE